MSQQAIQEKCTYPKLSELQQCVPPSLYAPCKLLNLDVKSAHKRIKVKPEHQGLLAFQFRDTIYHYQVLHFGGTCSAYYRSRLSAIFLRFFHHFLYVYHFGLVFVDDFIFGLDSVAAPLQTSTLLLCIAYLNIPLSWHKLELGYHITWIGWDIDTWSDTITLPQDKMNKILENISELRTSGKFKRSHLESVTGNLLWVSGLFPFLRWYLGVLYTILSRPGFQLVRLNKEQISRVLALLNDHGQLTDLLQRPYVPQGSILARMGKFQFHSGELAHFKQSCFDLNFAWTSFWNCRSNRVQVLEEEALIFQHLYLSLRQSIPRTTLSQNRRIPLQVGADAFASAGEFGLGAWITFPARDCWISMIGNTSDLPDIFHTGNLQRHIVSFETVAQCLVLIMFNRSGLRGADFLIQSKLDNQASEAIIAQGFTQLPIPLSLMRALQKLTYNTTISFQPYRCSSADNKRADDLSRGQCSQELSSSRFHINFVELFNMIFPSWFINCWLACKGVTEQVQQWCMPRVQVVPGRAGGGSFRRKKWYIARKEFAYRMCARRPTSAMPKPFLCCERAFCCSMVVMWPPVLTHVMSFDVVVMSLDAMWLLVLCHVTWCNAMSCDVRSCDVPCNGHVVCSKWFCDNAVIQSTILYYKVLLCNTKYYSSTTQYYKVLLQYYSVLHSTTTYYSSTTLYYKVLLQYYSVLQSTTPVLLCTTKYYSSTTLYYKVLLQYYSVLHSTTTYYSSTTLYYKVLRQYYSVLQSTTPVLLCTTKYYSSTTQYYNVLFQYCSVLKYYSSTTLYYKAAFMIDPWHIWHDWCPSHMKRHLQCAE